MSSFGRLGGRRLAVIGWVVALGSGGASVGLLSAAPPAGATPSTTLVSVFCSPNPVVEQTPTTCHALVVSLTGPPAPTGTVKFTATGRGVFATPSCTLSRTSSTDAACSVTYTPHDRKNKTQTITGSYGGDSSHAAGNGSTPLHIAGTSDLTG
jgi:hypothetical protein